MTRDLIIERFRDGGPGHRPPRGPAAERGDHFLNPGYVPKGPLKLAAVLVGLVDRPHGLHLLLTQRTDHLSHHPGQVSFPGGHIEDDDDGPEGAARTCASAGNGQGGGVLDGGQHDAALYLRNQRDFE